MKVKVLTVKQPWALLLIAGLKDVENRNWKTEYRGPLYIHASKGFDWSALFWLHDNGFIDEGRMVMRHFGIIPHDTVAEKSRITRHQDEFGAIIGCVHLDYCNLRSASKWGQPEVAYHWEVTAPQAITPTPCKGKLGIWEYEL